MYGFDSSERFVSAEFHGQDQADLGRFFLPDITPEESVGWPSHGVAAALADDFEEDDFLVGEYERDLEASLLERAEYSALGTEYGSTHDSYGTEWEV